MKVGIGISRSIVVDNDVDSLDINSSTKDISRDLNQQPSVRFQTRRGNAKREERTHENPLLKVLELLVPLDPLLLGESRVDRNRREVALPQKTVKLSGSRNGLDENDDLGAHQKMISLSLE